MAIIHGIDLSSENGRWNWDPWKPDANTPEGLNFAFARATSWDGAILGDDEEFQSNWRNMLHMGIVRGAYAEPRPGLSAPQQQATSFYRSVQRHGGTKDGDLIVCALDPIYTGVEPATFTNEWLIAYSHELNALFPQHRVIEYMDLTTAESGVSAGLERWHLWLAQYGVPSPTVPERWKHDGVTFWQSQGTVPPDRDQFAGTREDLELFCMAHVR